MSGKRMAFGVKPAAPTADAWVQQGNGAEMPVETPPQGVLPKADIYTARLTIDVTPELRGRIKVAAFRQGVTVAEMVRDLLETRFPEDGADA
ncbi:MULTISPECIES: chromosome partitioning protein ParB [unclassified Nitrobacter]|uniref:ribbon-helix-helix protein n=1 Tax=unclassified Nitrobacter TaxID=2620411 RepID=UPI00092CC7B1|nr:MULTISPECIES: chromosome partitioning protein ParB [unclassified Nitrobacter]MBN9147910.1 chromosome partitioning protein ParB [Nitrobacter sp.]MBN9489928.1 chromosome partitioning protein ParB [Alphaproteobacteria bacterium]OJV01406.1 MAG: chromosome partitioning protein ParB [Nitrobacter sp. 62-23]